MGILDFSPRYKQRFDSFVRPLVETHTGLVYVDARKFYEPRRPKIDVIFNMIREARLVVVELSQPNPNVFLELGFALSCDKHLVIICEREAWKKTWEENPPFDLQGRELLIYDDDVDLKVRLGASIADAFYRSRYVTNSWIPTDKLCHIRSTADFSSVPEAIVWSDQTLQFPFAVKYKVILERPDANPDIRLLIVPSCQDYPRVVCIFPWEHYDIDANKAECHIDIFMSENADHIRLQQISVCEKSQLADKKEWSVFVAFKQPNLVFESSLFEEKVERLVVSMNDLLQRGLPVATGFRLGFTSPNTGFAVRGVTVQEIYRC